MNRSEEYIAFYKEIGIALSQWAAVEWALAQITCLCVEDADKWMLYQGVYSIENFRSRLQFSETLILEKFRTSQQSLAEWSNTLSGRLQRASRLRNKLAHWLPVEISNSKTAGRRFALIPPPKPDMDQIKKRPAPDKPPAGSLCLRDINAAAYEFQALHRHVANFGARVRGLEEPFPIADEQAKNPRTIQSLNARIHEALGHPLKPSRRKS